MHVCVWDAGGGGQQGHKGAAAAAAVVSAEMPAADVAVAVMEPETMEAAKPFSGCRHQVCQCACRTATCAGPPGQQTAASHTVGAAAGQGWDPHLTGSVGVFTAQQRKHVARPARRAADSWCGCGPHARSNAHVRMAARQHLLCNYDCTGTGMCQRTAGYAWLRLHRSVCVFRGQCLTRLCGALSTTVLCNSI